MTNDATKWLVYEPVKAVVTRIMPELAIEIGLNESIILLQISFWLSTCNNVEDGKYWTFQTLRDMKDKAFPYWSIETIRRTIKNLADKKYIFVGNFNKRKGDRTQWFALNPDKLSELTSIVTLPEEKYNLVSKRDKLSQNETPTPQNETTLPEITTETTQKEYIAPVSAVDDAATKKPVAAVNMNSMKDAIAAVFQYDWKTMTGTEKGLVQKTARELCLAGVCIEEVPALYAYCKKQFTSFKAGALSGNVTEWRKTQKKIIQLSTPVDLSKWETPDPFAFLESEGA